MGLVLDRSGISSEMFDVPLQSIVLLLQLLHLHGKRLVVRNLLFVDGQAIIAGHHVVPQQHGNRDRHNSGKATARLHEFRTRAG